MAASKAGCRQGASTSFGSGLGRRDDALMETQKRTAVEGDAMTCLWKHPVEATRVVATLQAGVLALTLAVIGSLTLFGMTVWLLVKGGDHVGLHLQLLRYYLIGYSVTWTGSVVGFVYGGVVGGVVGWSIGHIYNAVVRLRHVTPFHLSRS